MTMFPDAHHIKIKGGNFTAVNINEQTGITGLQILYQGASHGASHDSLDYAPKCHPETRKTIVGDIMSWIEDPSRPTSVLWFNGPAGAGKTAIANTLSERCAKEQWLAGSYFFSRLAIGRSDAACLFPTIAYQLSLAISSVGKVIEEVVAKDPSVVKKKLEIQLQKLIVEPLQQALDLPPQPIVILIDGLDECEGEAVQSHLLRLLGSIFQRPSVGGLTNICFIVTSRPEPWIRDEFTIEPLSHITRQMFLGQTDEANDDIRTFLSTSFMEIHDSPKHRLTMSNVAKPWPSYRVLDDLVDRASGQFIYPATVIKFVDDPNYRPTDRLDIISSMPAIMKLAPNTNPLAALDQLYTQIISTSTDRKRTLEILGALIAMQSAPQGLYLEWNPLVELLRIAERLLGLHSGDGPLALRMVHSLVHIAGRALISDIPDDNLSSPEGFQVYFFGEDESRFHHKSFLDYLVDPSRSLEYCVDMEQMHTRLAFACMVTMQTFSLQPASRISCFTWGYAIISWTHHIAESGIPQRTLLQALARFDLYACYVDPLGPSTTGEECWNTIKRVAFPARPATVIARITEKLSSEIDKTCPDPADIKVAREFLFSSGESDFGWPRLERAVNWMQKSPESPTELMVQYQVIVHILHHYSRASRRRTPKSDDDFRRDARKAVRPSIDRWTKMKELLTLTRRTQ